MYYVSERLQLIVNTLVNKVVLMKHVFVFSRRRWWMTTVTGGSPVLHSAHLTASCLITSWRKRYCLCYCIALHQSSQASWQRSWATIFYLISIFSCLLEINLYLYTAKHPPYISKLILLQVVRILLASVYTQAQNGLPIRPHTPSSS